MSAPPPPPPSSDGLSLEKVATPFESNIPKMYNPFEQKSVRFDFERVRKVRNFSRDCDSHFDVILRSAENGPLSCIIRYIHPFELFNSFVKTCTTFHDVVFFLLSNRSSEISIDEETSFEVFFGDLRTIPTRFARSSFFSVPIDFLTYAVDKGYTKVVESVLGEYEKSPIHSEDFIRNSINLHNVSKQKKIESNSKPLKPYPTRIIHLLYKKFGYHSINCLINLEDFDLAKSVIEKEVNNQSMDLKRMAECILIYAVEASEEHILKVFDLYVSSLVKYRRRRFSLSTLCNDLYTSKTVSNKGYKHHSDKFIIHLIEYMEENKKYSVYNKEEETVILFTLGPQESDNLVEGLVENKRFEVLEYIITKQLEQVEHIKNLDDIDKTKHFSVLTSPFLFSSIARKCVKENKKMEDLFEKYMDLMKFEMTSPLLSRYWKEELKKKRDLGLRYFVNDDSQDIFPAEFMMKMIFSKTMKINDEFVLEFESNSNDLVWTIQPLTDMINEHHIEPELLDIPTELIERCEKRLECVLSILNTPQLIKPGSCTQEQYKLISFFEYSCFRSGGLGSQRRKLYPVFDRFRDAVIRKFPKSGMIMKRVLDEIFQSRSRNFYTEEEIEQLWMIFEKNVTDHFSDLIGWVYEFFRTVLASYSTQLDLDLKAISFLLDLTFREEFQSQIFMIKPEHFKSAKEKHFRYDKNQFGERRGDLFLVLFDYLEKKKGVKWSEDLSNNEVLDIVKLCLQTNSEKIVCRGFRFFNYLKSIRIGDDFLGVFVEKDELIHKSLSSYPDELKIMLSNIWSGRKYVPDNRKVYRCTLIQLLRKSFESNQIELLKRWMNHPFWKDIYLLTLQDTYASFYNPNIYKFIKKNLGVIFNDQERREIFGKVRCSGCGDDNKIRILDGRLGEQYFVCRRCTDMKILFMDENYGGENQDEGNVKLFCADCCVVDHHVLSPKMKAICKDCQILI